MPEHTRYSVAALRTFAERILVEAGLEPGEAALLGESLIEADLRGIGSHGLTRLRTYAQRVQTGVVQAGSVPRIVREAPGALAVDGCNGAGVPVGVTVMDWCVERARTQGSCFATVCNGNHFGIGAFFTMRAARAGMIGLAMSNAPASMVPAGGKRPLLGTNPLSVAIPAGTSPPLVLDMATSTVAQGKIILAAKEGATEIPGHWAVDENGQPTTDPQAALRGAMLPFGGAKGYAIALIIDVLCSALGGSAPSTGIHSFWDDFERPQNVGFFMGAWSIAHFMPLPEFHKRIDALFTTLKSSPPAPGFDEVCIPGEGEQRRAEQGRREGLAYAPAVMADLSALAQEYKVAFIEEGCDA